MSNLPLATAPWLVYLPECRSSQLFPAIGENPEKADKTGVVEPQKKNARLGFPIYCFQAVVLFAQPMAILQKLFISRSRKRKSAILRKVCLEEM